MWPPLRAVTAIRRARISAASAGNWSAGKAWTSAGPRMASSKAISQPFDSSSDESSSMRSSAARSCSSQAFRSFMPSS